MIGTQQAQGANYSQEHEIFRWSQQRDDDDQVGDTVQIEYIPGALITDVDPCGKFQ